MFIFHFRKNISFRLWLRELRRELIKKKVSLTLGYKQNKYSYKIYIRIHFSLW